MVPRIVYLAGPMRGLPEFNYPAFDRAAKQLRDKGYMVLNPAEVNHHSNGIRSCMAVDLTLIALNAEGIVVLPGWEKSTGAKTEVALAECIGIPVIPLQAALY